jgi:amino acid transporter
MLRRSLGLFDVICIGLNAIVGSGVFALPDDLFREVGWLSPLAFLLCALGLLPVALCYAEAAGSVDRTGGPYLYTSEAFGPRIGFAVGWMCFANAVFSFAAVASIAAANFGRMVPSLSSETTLKTIAVLLVAVFAALNYRGAKPGALAIDAFTIAKFAVLIIGVGALIPAVEPERLTGPLPADLGRLGSATFIALFAAQGFEVVPVPAGEARDPRRDLPIAIVGSLFAASVLYVIVQTVLVGAAPDLGAESATPLADAAYAVGPGLGLTIAFGGLVSTIGFVSGSALGTPRYLYATSVDGHLPRVFAGIHPHFASPHRAVVATALVTIALVIPFDYRLLIGISNVAVAVQYLGTCLAVLVLRKRLGNAPRGFKRWAPLLGAATSTWIFWAATGEELVWAAGSMTVGLAAVALTRLSKRVRPA